MVWQAALEDAPVGTEAWITAWGRPLSWIWRVLGALESVLFRRVGNAAFWREACYPSSNGFCTAHGLARMYGMLANGGRASSSTAFPCVRAVRALAAAARVARNRAV